MADSGQPVARPGVSDAAAEPTPEQATQRSSERGAERGAERGLGGALRAVIGMTLLSRFAGLARDVMVGRIFGDTATNSAFAAAFQIPNVFRRLFGEGALSAAFIPAYTRALREDGAEARRLASLTAAAVAAATSLLTALISSVLLALLFLLPADAERDLSLKLILVMLPFMPLICVAAVLAGMLQCFGKFGPASSGPLVLNGFIVVVAGYSLWSGALAGEATAYLLGVATVLSGITQCLWFARLLRGHTTWHFAHSELRMVGPRAKEMYGKFVPVAIGLGTLQLNTLLDTAIAMYPIWVGPVIFGLAYPLDSDSNGILAQSSRLYQFPLGVFGIAVATAIFPLLSRQAAQRAQFVGTLRRGVRLSLFIGLPATAGLLLVRHDLVSVLFGRVGESQAGFSPEGVARAATVVGAFSIGVWAYSLNHVLTRSLYAIGDTVTPMRISLWIMGLNIAANFGLIWMFRESGLALATSLAACVQVMVLAVVVSRRLREKGWSSHDGVYGSEMFAAILKLMFVTAVMAACVGAFLWFVPQPVRWSTRLARLVGATVIGAGSYLALAKAMRLPELGWMLSRERAGEAQPTDPAAAGAAIDESQNTA